MKRHGIAYIFENFILTCNQFDSSTIANYLNHNFHTKTKKYHKIIKTIDYMEMIDLFVEEYQNNGFIKRKSGVVDYEKSLDALNGYTESFFMGEPVYNLKVNKIFMVEKLDENYEKNVIVKTFSNFWLSSIKKHLDIFHL